VKPMAVNKKHDEFHALDMNVGWETPLGYFFSYPATSTGGKSFPSNTYAVRPPGAHQGPFKSTCGCPHLEMHYFDPV